jgi:hypothetical protein
MAMKPVFEIKLFRANGAGGISDRERQRSQMALIWLMEALCQINQGLIRLQRDIGQPYPLLYRSGIFYKREPPPVSTFAEAAAGCQAGEDYCDVDNGVLQRAPEFWQDIATTTEKGYGDCEDLACHRIAELREVFRRQASPAVTYRVGPDGSYKFHALVGVRGPSGWRMEDPSRKLGMGWEEKFSKLGQGERDRYIVMIDNVQKQVSPQKFLSMQKVRV